MPQPNYGLDPYADEAAEIERKRRYAEALREQSGQPITPYSVGGQQGPISWTQGAAKLLQGYNAGAAGRDADARAKALRERVQGDRTSDMSALAAALRGSPGGMQADAADNVTQIPARPAGQIDPSVMGQLRTPDMQNIAMQMYLKQLQPKAPIKAGPGDQLIDPTTFKPVYSVPPKPDKPAAIPAAIQEYEYARNQGFKGTLQDFELAKRKAGATNVNVDARVGQKYGEKFAGKMADLDADLLEAARKAPELAARSNRIKEMLASGKVTTGFGADYRLAFGKAAGLAGASDAETLKNTETLVADLASNTMDAIKASGMGGGTGFSNADRDFLEKAKGGKITLEASTINRLADLSHKAAALSTDRWNKRVKQIPASALEGTGITQDEVKVPPLFAGGKQPMYAVNPQTKQRIMSTDGGATWKPAQ